MLPDVQCRVEFLRRIATAAKVSRDREYVITYLQQGQWKFEHFFASEDLPHPSKRPREQGSKLSAEFRRQRTLLSRIRDGADFGFWFGDPDAAAVFMSNPANDLSRAPQAPPPTVMYTDVIWLMDYDMLTPEALRRAIFDAKSSVVLILMRFSFIASLYSGLSEEGATVSSQVLSSPLKPHALEPRLKDPATHDPISVIYDRFDPHISYNGIKPTDYVRVAVCLIAYLETGKDLLNNTSVSRLLGICIGDSIYISRNIIMDPCEPLAPQKFTRLLGSIGKPGLTLLTCPEDPDSRGNESANWRQCTEPYKGVREDMFRHKTLHLSLTEWSNQLWGVSAVGERDSNGTHAEAVVSVRDAGRWVADIDPLRALMSGYVFTLDSQEACTHPPEVQRRPLLEMKAIETWDQVLDCEEGLMVVKSHKNWIGRLAVVSVLGHHCKLRNKRIVICPEKVCWQCAGSTMSLNQNIIFVY